MTQIANNAPKIAQQLARLSRPQNVVYSGLLALEIAWLKGSILYGVLCYLLLLCLYAIAVTYNNIRDVQVDRRNNRYDNPLVRAKLSIKTGYAWIGLNTVAVATIQPLLHQPTTILLSSTYVVLSFCYSNRRINLQSRGFTGMILLAVCYGCIPVLLAGSAATLWWVALLQIPLLLPLLLAKDYKDVIGDRAEHKRTPLVRYGVRPVQLTAYVLSSLAASVCLAIVFRGHSLVIGIFILPLLCVYVFCTCWLHYRQGKVSKYFLRLPQLCLLAMSLLLVEAV
jgi:4-hydroxybenzoate polyprenyltransferase